MKNIENNMNFTPMEQDDLKTINGGEPITLAVGIACGILFVGSIALGFAIGSRIWK